MSTQRDALAVVGVGHLGTFHAQKLRQLEPDRTLILFDSSPGRAQELAAALDARVSSDLEELLAASEAVVLATPTETHFDLGMRVLDAGCHLMVEKPMTQTVEQGRRLVARARETGLTLQVGHVERFNPLFRAVRDRIGTPAFVTAERLAPFVPRSMDVDVVLDLMVHDLDILLSLVDAELVRLDAIGVGVLTPWVDIANVHLRFANGTVANLTASRVSQERVRKIRFFGPSGYISLDLGSRCGRRVHVEADPDGPIEVPATGRFRVQETVLEAPPEDALAQEARAFLEAVRTKTPPAVSGEEALRVLELAERIRAEVGRSLAQLAPRADLPTGPPVRRS
jgi:predicted dehydrogenase